MGDARHGGRRMFYTQRERVHRGRLRKRCDSKFRSRPKSQRQLHRSTKDRRRPRKASLVRLCNTNCVFLFAWIHNWASIQLWVDYLEVDNWCKARPARGAAPNLGRASVCEHQHSSPRLEAELPFRPPTSDHSSLSDHILFSRPFCSPVPWRLQLSHIHARETSESTFTFTPTPRPLLLAPIDSDFILLALPMDSPVKTLHDVSTSTYETLKDGKDDQTQAPSSERPGLPNCSVCRRAENFKSSFLARQFTLSPDSHCHPYP